ncbi:MAG: hypothetical protein WCH35_08285 [Comamonadaceae bacterium]
MTSIISRFTTSLIGLIGEPASNIDFESRIEGIRQAMLDSMTEFLDGKATQSTIWDKVRYAPSIQTLWYLRIDLMAQLSAYCGESVAAATLSNITEKFRGVVPSNQMTKSNRFAR